MIRVFDACNKQKLLLTKSAERKPGQKTINNLLMRRGGSISHRTMNERQSHCAVRREGVFGSGAGM